MKGFTYVDILESIEEPDRFYVGLTDDLAARLAKHNHGDVMHSRKYRPWRGTTAIAYKSRKRAANSRPI